jgi:hypothetical protein
MTGDGSESAPPLRSITHYALATPMRQRTNSGDDYVDAR